MNIEVFLSYASEDRLLADIYLELLTSSELVQRGNVFSFERPGARTAAGKLLSPRIQEAMTAPASIALISRSYIRSAYCVGEFGFLKFSSLISDRILIPLLVPPLTPEEAGPFFQDIGLLDGDAEPNSLNRLLDSISDSLSRRPSYTLIEEARNRASRRLAEHLASVPAQEPQLAPLLSELPDESLGKILALRHARLTRIERDTFYQRFQQLEPRYHIPLAPVAPRDVQAELDSISPIDDSILSNLCETFGVDTPDLTRPITVESKQQIVDTVSRLHKVIYAEVKDGSIARDAGSARARSWREAFDYLSCPEILVGRKDLSKTDVILVPGARRGHIFRADEAVQVARISTSPSLVILSGGHPIFDDEQDLPFGEADALAERFMLQYPDRPESLTLRIDNRARTTAETVAHMRVHLQPLVVGLKRPAILTLVTSPYHMRRLYYLVTQALIRMSHLVGGVQGSLSTASFDWAVVANPQSDAQFALAEYGVGLYLIEIAKLYGGRATGEF